MLGLKKSADSSPDYTMPRSFPQAFSHVALVNLAFNLAQASNPAEQRAGGAA